MTEVFPFFASDDLGGELFRKYVRANIASLREKYGSLCFTGKPNTERIWTYYEVEVRVLSDHTVEFITFGMASPVYGGRGTKQESIEVTYPGDELRLMVLEQKHKMARAEFKRREEERKKLLLEMGVQSVYKEMFP